MLQQLLSGQQELKDLLQRVISSQERLAGEISELTSQLRGLIFLLSSCAVGQNQQLQQGQPLHVGNVIKLPLSPKDLNAMLLSIERSGYLWVNIGNLTYLCPAKTVTTIRKQVAPGYVVVYASPFKYMATYYSDQINVELYVDGKPMAGLNKNFFLTSDGQLELAEFFFVYQEATLIVTNNSNVDTTFAFFGEAINIKREYFDQFYRLLLEAGYSAIKNLVTLIGGRIDIS